MYTTLFLLISTAAASNSASEGFFLNASHAPIECLKDVDGCLDVAVVESGGVCQGDAVRLPSGGVFKIPNHSTFECAETCTPIDWTSALIFLYAKQKNGSEKYDEMSFETFKNLMRKDFCE